MKKLIALLLAMLMLVSMVACAAKKTETAEPEKEAAPIEEETSAEEKVEEKTEETEAPEEDALPFEGVELSFWFPPHDGTIDVEFWNETFEQFTAETGATVTVTLVPWGELTTKYLSGFMSGEGPDVFYTSNDFLYDFLDAGMCLELSPYFSEEEIANQLFWDAGYMMGGQYAVPFNATDAFNGGFAVNMDILNAAGVEKAPETREELIDAAVKVKDAGVCEYPVLMQFADQYSANDIYFPLLWSSGGDLLNEAGDTVLTDSDASLAACQFLYDLANKYGVLSQDSVTMTEEEMMNLFNEGKVAMAPIPSNNYSANIANGLVTFNNTLTVVGDGEHDAMIRTAVDTMAVSSDSKNTEAAIALLKFIIRTDIRDAFNVSIVQSTMTRLNADQPEKEYTLDWQTKYYPHVTEMTKGAPICKGLATMHETFNNYCQLLVMGEITPEEAVEAMTMACQSALDG